MELFPLHLADFYKVQHPFQYPKGTQDLYVNLTARSSKLANMGPEFDNKVVFVGLQAVIKTLLLDLWNRNFFDKSVEEVVSRYHRRMDSTLGPGKVTVDHIRSLHTLGFLPITIKALSEGSRVNVGVPVLTIQVSDEYKTSGEPFGWVATYIETQLTAELWKKITIATIAYEYRKLLVKYAIATGSPLEFVDWQGHDFSARGMSGVHDFSYNNIGHLASFLGTDTISAIDTVEELYNAEDEYIGGSVVASEHSIATLRISMIEDELIQTGSYRGVSLEEAARLLKV